MIKNYTESRFYKDFMKSLELNDDLKIDGHPMNDVYYRTTVARNAYITARTQVELGKEAFERLFPFDEWIDGINPDDLINP